MPPESIKPAAVKPPKIITTRLSRMNAVIFFIYGPLPA
jgi:hypothetical protein